MAASGSTLCCRCSCITYHASKNQNKVAAAKERDYPDSEELLEMMDFFDLGPVDVNRLYHIFLKADEDNMGEISSSEFYSLMNVEPTVFGDYLFHLIDVDASGGLDFEEFVQSVLTYCNFGREDILKFCFYMFDPKKTGFIEDKELKDLCSILAQSRPTMADFSRPEYVLAKFDTNKDGRIEYSEFLNMNSKFPALLFPAFEMQDRLADATLGVNFFDDRRWASQEAVKREEKQASERRKKAKKLRDKAKRDRINEVLKKRMGAFRYYFCCCMRQAELTVMRAEKLGRPAFDDPVRQAAFSRFESAGEDPAGDALRAKLAADRELQVQKQLKVREAKEERRRRRSKVNKGRHTTTPKRGYIHAPGVVGKSRLEQKIEAVHRENEYHPTLKAW